MVNRLERYPSDSQNFEFYSLIDLLRHRGQYQSRNTAFTFLPKGEIEEVSITYQELDKKARAIAATLQSMSATGERALILYQPGLEFIAAFFGCLYAGVIAVPVYPPRRNHHSNRLQAIVSDAQATIALTTTSVYENIGKILKEKPELKKLRILTTDETDIDKADNWQRISIDSNDLAFLQYTSGSTGTPKGVMVTHGNIIHNQELIKTAFGHSEKTIFVGWLPLFHDMGLIGNILQPMYLGIPCILMPPVAFLQKPIHWLKAISKYRATTSGGPNFAYDLCVNKIKPEQLESLDLSSWEVAFTGAEPIRPETLERFARTFADCGFRYDAFYPCYGMAESTLLVSGGLKTEAPIIHCAKESELSENRIVSIGESRIDSQRIVGCGRSWLNQKIAIVNPETLVECSDGEVGEIWVQGESVAKGYWNRSELTQKSFHAYLGNTGEGPFLRTGDLGFLEDGELFVTGRLKDVIIIRGRNYYPQDIEFTVENSHVSLRSNCSAAFSVEIEGEECLVVACEVERTHLRKLNTSEVVSAVRHSIWTEHELNVYGVLLLKTGSIPKTSSGKIQRHACRKDWLNQQLNLVGEWTVKDLVETRNIEHPANESLPIHTDGNQPLASQNTISQRSADELLEWLRNYSCERINSRLIDERRCIPPHIVLDFGKHGLLGLQVPKQYGGMGFNYYDTFRVFEQLGAIDLTLAAFVGVHHVLGTRPIMKYAKDSVKNKFLPMIAQGRDLAAFAITEAGAGSNPRAISTTAIPDNSGGWRIRGEKIWIGTGSWASVTNVFVQMLDANHQPVGITGFVIPEGTKGFHQGPEAMTMGMRGMVQNSIYFDEVRVSSEYLLGEMGNGLQVAQDAMMFGRLGLAVISLGGMKRCAQLMLRYSQHRHVSTGRLLDNPVTLVRLRDLTQAITALETLVFTIAQLLDRGVSIPEEVYAACKISGPEFLWQAADHLVQLLGGRGYIETNIAPQILRDARLLRIFEGPTEALNMFLGSRVIQKGEELEQFLSETLGVREVAKLLKNATEEIRDRITNNSRFSENHTTLRWVYFCTGELTTWAILLAAIKTNLKQLNSQPLQTAATWVSFQFEQKLQLVLTGTPAEMVKDEANHITAIVENYAKKIGDLEQALPGENHALDEFLRKTFVENHQKNSDVELNKDQNGADFVVEHKNYQQKENIANWIEKWLAKQPDIEVAAITRQASFADYGMDSVLAVELVQALEDWLKTSLDATILWNFTTIESLAQYLVSKNQSKKKVNNTSIKSKSEESTKTEIETSVVEELAALEKLLAGD